MRRTAVFRIAALVALAATPAGAVVGRIRDGGTASVVMVLGRDASRAGFCSGVVIDRRAVLTSAHCVHGPADTRIHFKDADGAPVLLPVARVVRHAGYNADAVAARARSVDLAIVVTSADLPARFVPAALAAASATPGTPFTVAGYGLTREGDPRSGGSLHTVDVTLREPASRLLLWLAGDGGACTGDSGGPVLDAGGAVVGITAFAQGEGSSRCGALTQAVRVEPFRAWIAQTLGR